MDTLTSQTDCRCSSFQFVHNANLTHQSCIKGYQVLIPFSFHEFKCSDHWNSLLHHFLPFWTFSSCSVIVTFNILSHFHFLSLVYPPLLFFLTDFDLFSFTLNCLLFLAFIVSTFLTFPILLFTLHIVFLILVTLLSFHFYFLQFWIHNKISIPLDINVHGEI